jgi:hypothetical protein
MGDPLPRLSQSLALWQVAEHPGRHVRIAQKKHCMEVFRGISFSQQDALEENSKACFMEMHGGVHWLSFPQIPPFPHSNPWSHTAGLWGINSTRTGELPGMESLWHGCGNAANQHVPWVATKDRCGSSPGFSKLIAARSQDHPCGLASMEGLATSDDGVRRKHETTVPWAINGPDALCWSKRRGCMCQSQCECQY